MSRHFTIPTMLRMTPNLLLKQFFERMGVRLLSLDWRKLGERQVDPIQTALGWNPAEEQARVQAALASVFELACAEGWQAILDAARELDEGNPVTKLPEDACHYERAMWTWLNEPDLFAHASALQQFGNLTRWHKRTGLPILVPRITPATIRDLSVALSGCLKREEGRGSKCTIEYYRRNGTDYLAAYPDDFVQTITTHDENGSLVARPLRQTFEIVFGLRPDEGELDLYAQVTSSIKQKLIVLFGQIILGADLAPQPCCKPFDLNRLKQRDFRLDTDPADRVAASLCGLRLALPRWGDVTLKTRQSEPKRDIYDLMDRCLNEKELRLDQVNVTLASFRLEFLAGRRPRSLTFDVSFPDHCSVRSRRPEWIALTHKYLRRWRIAHV